MQQRERPGDDAGRIDVFQGDWPALRMRLFRVHHGPGVQRRPLPCHDGDVGKVLRRRAEAMVVPHHRV